MKKPKSYRGIKAGEIRCIRHEGKPVFVKILGFCDLEPDPNIPYIRPTVSVRAMGEKNSWCFRFEFVEWLPINIGVPQENH